ncbi:ATP-grasp domain-containing protein [Siminovitchia acidinfaciens]|nr:ATP-grasp domain-containing protein [Siminovitchia acidinfaciens]
MHLSTTVLLTGVGSPSAPGVIKSLRSARNHHFKIVGMDIDPDVATKAMVDKFFVGPEATSSHFIEECLTLCRAEKVDVILPLVSMELPRFSKNKQRFKGMGIEVSVSEHSSLIKAMNKGKLFQALKDKKISVPQSITVHTVDQLRKAIYDLGYPNRPVCMKPTVSDGSRGFRILDSQKNRLEHLFYEKPDSSYISVQELLDMLKDAYDIPETIVMEYLPHEEYSVDILANQGEVIIAIPRLREKITDGISVKSLIVKEDDVIEYTSRIVKELGLHGNIGVQVRRDQNHQPKILEINPRIQGTIVHCTAAGVNLPYLAIKLAKNMAINPEECTVQWGTRMRRYWDEVYFDSDGNSIQF